MQFEPGSLPARAATAAANGLSRTRLSPPAPFGGAVFEYLRAKIGAGGTLRELGLVGSGAGGSDAGGSDRGPLLVVVETIVAVLAVIGVVGFLSPSNAIG